MSGYLFVTEYANMGDLALETPMEPATRTQRIAVGTISQPLHPDTRLVVMSATFPCRVLFLASQVAALADLLPAEEGCVLGHPISENIEVTRVVHQGTGLRIAALDATG